MMEGAKKNAKSKRDETASHMSKSSYIVFCGLFLLSVVDVIGEREGGKTNDIFCMSTIYFVAYTKIERFY